jgi:hypothetical protein
MSKKAKFSVSTKLLVDTLQLPPDTEIIGATWNLGHQDLELFVIHPDLLEVPEGEMIPIVNPQISIRTEFSWNQS